MESWWKMIADYRIPSCFREVHQQKIPKKVLMSIVNNPDTSPKIINIFGPSGTGKTVLAKCFAKSLACTNRYRDGDCCCECDDCLNRLVIYNYNGNTITTSDDLVSIKEISNKNLLYYQVVLIEEIDKVSYKLQQELLEIIESSSELLFFVLTTERRSEIINSIKNRGMVIELSREVDEDYKEFISKVVEEENIDIDEKDLSTIVYRSEGNIRLAYNLLDKYKLLGSELLNNLLLDTRINIIKFFVASFIQNKDRAYESLSNIMKSPLAIIKKDYESLILELMQIKTGVIQPKDEYIKALYTACSNKMIDFFHILNDRVIYDMFENETEIQSALWFIYMNVGKLRQI